jgi:putative intracellular protease/amidase
MSIRGLPREVTVPETSYERPWTGPAEERRAGQCRALREALLGGGYLGYQDQSPRRLAEKTRTTATTTTRARVTLQNQGTERIMKILMVLTSHDQLGNTGRKTGFWLEELAAPYYVFKDAGAQITLASPKGGRPPLDPKSNEPNFQTDITRRFEKDPDANAQLDRTVRLDSVKQGDYDTVFYPGGHGPMWDLAEDKNSIKLLESFLAAGKTFAVVCHSTGALRHVKTPDGKVLVNGKTVTGFTNGEEEAVGLTKVVPFLVENEMMSLGATFSKVKDWGVHTVADGQLITGQNPASSGPAAKLLMDTLNKKAK